MSTINASDSGGLFSPATSKKDSRAVVPAFAEPDIHSLSQVPKDRHRRLRGCTLPVLKQFGDNLGSLISVVHRRNGGQNLSRRETQITNHTRSPPPLSAFPVHPLCRIRLPMLGDCAAATAA